MITVALLVFGFGGWSLTTEIDGAIVANGQLEVEKNKQIVNHPDGGVVAEIAVKEAQAVKAGDLLIRLDGSLLQSELAIVEGQLFEMLARRARLEAERDDKDAPSFSGEIGRSGQRPAPMLPSRSRASASCSSPARKVLRGKAISWANARGQIGSQIEGVNAQIDALKQQLALIEQELTAQQTPAGQGPCAIQPRAGIAAQQSLTERQHGRADRLKGAKPKAVAPRLILKCCVWPPCAAKKPTPSCAILARKRWNWSNAAAP